VSSLRKHRVVDRLDARMLLALVRDPRATVMGLATHLGISRNTAQARLAKLETNGTLWSFERMIDPSAIGYPITAVVTMQVRQQLLTEVSTALAAIPEIVEVFGLTGPTDLMARVVAPDADDLYRIAAVILATPGVERTDTALVMRRLVNYRLQPLLQRLVEDLPRG
jgi:DNA-binding Lrp family transcriptional regulator